MPKRHYVTCSVRSPSVSLRLRRFLFSGFEQPCSAAPASARENHCMENGFAWIRWHWDSASSKICLRWPFHNSLSQYCSPELISSKGFCGLSLVLPLVRWSGRSSVLDPFVHPLQSTCLITVWDPERPTASTLRSRRAEATACKRRAEPQAAQSTGS